MGSFFFLSLNGVCWVIAVLLHCCSCAHAVNFMDYWLPLMVRKFCEIEPLDHTCYWTSLAPKCPIQVWAHHPVELLVGAILMLLLLAIHLEPGCSVCLVCTGWEYHLMSPHVLDVTYVLPTPWANLASYLLFNSYVNIMRSALASTTSCT